MVSVARKFLALFENFKFLPEILITLVAVCVWSAVGLGPYSGYNTPPEYGDFEAQRHWMELTIHLPILEWYFYLPEWWKLDYPPFTAYHSYVCGLIGNYISPHLFELESSQGIEGNEIKAFMRATAVISQLLFFVPPVYSVTGLIKNRLERLVAFASILLLPSLVIIDHGHFQFNSVMLGLFIYAALFIYKEHYIKASFFFVSALFFKQMALYYAPAIFFIILGSCLGPRTQWKLNFCLLSKVGITVLTTALIYLLPFILSLDQLNQILARVFPVGRGLWEDKVANVWCTINYTVLKLKENFTPNELQFMALGGTLLGITPSCIAGYLKGREAWFAVFACCSWAFYLFSFQVHEKSVLLPLIASWLVCVQNWKSQNMISMTRWISNISYFSLWPLLKREELHIQYFALLVLYNYLFTTRKNLLPKNWLSKLVVFFSYLAFAAVAVVEYFGLIDPQILAKYPDLFVVGNMAMSLGSFVYFWLWQMWFMITQ